MSYDAHLGEMNDSRDMNGYADTVSPVRGDGFVEIAASELKGRALAWAVCEVYRMTAIIVSGQVHVEASPGNWQPFDAEAMLRSLVLGHGIGTVMVPDEIVGGSA